MIIIGNTVVLFIPSQNVSVQLVIDIYLMGSLMFVVVVNLMLVEFVWMRVSAVLNTIGDVKEKVPEENSSIKKAYTEIDSLKVAIRASNIDRRTLLGIFIFGLICLTLMFAFRFKFVYLIVNLVLMLIFILGTLHVALVVKYTVSYFLCLF